jgi:hypothetical protein
MSGTAKAALPLPLVSGVSVVAIGLISGELAVGEWS